MNAIYQCPMVVLDVIRLRTTRRTSHTHTPLNGNSNAESTHVEGHTQVQAPTVAVHNVSSVIYSCESLHLVVLLSQTRESL